MSAHDRRKQILEHVKRRGFVSIEALARQFAVTPQTIRRDVNRLCERNLPVRYHGGAGLPSSVENLDYTTRQIMHLEEKQRIAREVDYLVRTEWAETVEDILWRRSKLGLHAPPEAAAALADRLAGDGGQRQASGGGSTPGSR